MREQDKGHFSSSDNVESKEGERRLLSCNKATIRPPSLNYEYELTDGLNIAFDILFDEVIRRLKHEYE